MRARAKKAIKPGLILLLAAAVGYWVPALATSGSHAAPKAPASAARAAAPKGAVTPTRVRVTQKAAAAVTINLCAKAGTKTMPDGTTVNIWGFVQTPDFTATPCSGLTANLPGPQLTVDAGDVVTVNLENHLSEPVSIIFPGQPAGPPDLVGAPASGSATYTFTATVGTYLYEAGTNVTRQVPMGLYGALVVNSGIAGQAYTSSTTAYDVQATLVLSEIDPAFNCRPTDVGCDPNTFKLYNYKPMYWLINGKGYNVDGNPSTDPIAVPGPAVGKRVLLRYLNAGLEQHTMTMLGMHQRVIAKDAFPVTYPFDVDAETIPTGSRLDTIATIPAGTPAAAEFPVYNRQLHLTNGDITNPGHQVPGGMMTFITVP